MKGSTYCSLCDGDLSTEIVCNLRLLLLVYHVIFISLYFLLNRYCVLFYLLIRLV